MKFLRRFKSKVGEQVTSLLKSVGFSSWKWWAKSFTDSKVVDYDLARDLYTNSNEDYSLGAGFCRRIIDGCTEYMGLPTASSEDDDLADWLNDSITEWWADALQQLFRNAMRDSKAVVRLAPYDWMSNPLISAEDMDRIKIEIVEPERCRFYYNPFNSEILEEVRITHHVPMQEREEPTGPDDGRAKLNDPASTIHEIVEVITRTEIRYYDVTADNWLTELEQANTWGVVPAWEIYNEWDETIGRGQSDYESVFPFIKAFHDVMLQSLQAHAYHSIPKVKFKLNDIDTFLRNNFPDSFEGPEGEEVFNGKVQWKGKEILFLQSEEDVEFVEAESVLGDSKTLMEFLFDCICSASQTPAWVLLRTEQGAQGSTPSDSTSFTKRIERKRKNFKLDLVKVFKIALVMSGRRPIHVKLAWDTVLPADESAESQALEQTTMALEVAATRGIISDQTYRLRLRRFLPEMKNPAREARDAEDNKPLPELQAANGNGNVPTVVGRGAGGANE